MWRLCLNGPGPGTFESTTYELFSPRVALTARALHSGVACGELVPFPFVQEANLFAGDTGRNGRGTPARVRAAGHRVALKTEVLPPARMNPERRGEPGRATAVGRE